MTTVLQVLSAARVWTLKDGTKHPTGFWAEEFVVPYTLFTDVVRWLDVHHELTTRSEPAQIIEAFEVL